MRNDRDTQTIFELSKSGRRAARLPDCDVPEIDVAELLPAEAVSAVGPALPELSEPQIIRHFVNLSTQNMSVDTHFYPLGSCTMKYNPKRNERAAAMPGFADLHPYQSDDTLQGMLEILFEMQEILQEISGLPACSLQPAAGAHGELTALLVAAAYFRDIDENRTKVLVPDNAHGTNPASAAMAGFDSVTVQTTAAGFVDMDDLAAKLDDQVAVMMITNPSTLGLFEPNMREIADQVHAKGGLIYLDGANMNAILGITQPGEFGADMQHYNPHKTFSGPHGGGGPGAGPICVIEKLAAYLPAPVVRKDGQRYWLDFDMPKSIGRVRAFFGQRRRLAASLCVHPHSRTRWTQSAFQKMLCSMPTIYSVASNIFLPVPQGERCMHEFVATASGTKTRQRHFRNGHRQAIARLRLPCSHGLFSAHGPRSHHESSLPSRKAKKRSTLLPRFSFVSPRKILNFYTMPRIRPR